MGEMPRDLSEEAVAAFMREVCCLNVQRIPAAELRAWEHSSGKEGWRIVAAHVRALVEREVAKERASTREKVREAVDAKHDAASICDKGDGWIEYDKTDDEIVSSVLGEEAPRG